MNNRENAKERAQTIFDKTKIKITTDGQRNLGAVIGTANFKQNHIKEKINQLIQELRVLSKIVWYEPQAAYSCFITGFKHKPTYFMRTIPKIGKELKQLDDVYEVNSYRNYRGINCSDLERKLLFPSKIRWTWNSDIFRNSRKRVQIFHHDIERSNIKDSKSTSATSI